MKVRGDLDVCRDVSVGGEVKNTTSDLNFSDANNTTKTLTEILEDYHSGYQVIESGKNVIIRDNKQSINFTMLTIDGDLTLEGDLWLA